MKITTSVPAREFTLSISEKEFNTILCIIGQTGYDDVVQKKTQHDKVIDELVHGIVDRADYSNLYSSMLCKANFKKVSITR